MNMLHQIADRWRRTTSQQDRQDRRQHPRSQVCLPIAVRDVAAERPRIVVALDVSPGGALLTPHVTGQDGERILVTADRFGGLISARIAGQRDRGTGITFDDEQEGSALAAWLCERADMRGDRRLPC